MNNAEVKNFVPIAFCFDRRVILGASVAIRSLIDAADENTAYDVRVLHSDISNDIQEEFHKMFENSRHRIEFHFIDKAMFSGFAKSRGSWREIVYYRFLIPEIVRGYDNVIYSDIDVFFKRDIRGVCELDLTGYELGAVRAERNKPDMVGHKYFSENKKEFVFWSGFLVINCCMFRRNNMFSNLIYNEKLLHDKLKFYDLDLMNATFQKIYPLDLAYCVLEPLYEFDNMRDCRDYTYLSGVYTDEELAAAKQNPAIIHYAGQLGKPWHRKVYPKYYKRCLDTLPSRLKTTTFRDFRKRLFSKI